MSNWKLDISHCSLLVDSYFPGSPATEHEPHYMLDTDTWEAVSCRGFLDASRTGLLGRTLWMPDLDLVPEGFRRRWGRYCLLKRRMKKER